MFFLIKKYDTNSRGEIATAKCVFTFCNLSNIFFTKHYQTTNSNLTQFQNLSKMFENFYIKQNHTILKSKRNIIHSLFQGSYQKNFVNKLLRFYRLLFNTTIAR